MPLQIVRSDITTMPVDASEGRKRRFVLMLEWLTLWPTIGPTPVSSQRRDIAAIRLGNRWSSREDRLHRAGGRLIGRGVRAVKVAPARRRQRPSFACGDGPSGWPPPANLTPRLSSDFSTPTSLTSNTSTLLGGITGGRPFSP